MNWIERYQAYKTEWDEENPEGFWAEYGRSLIRMPRALISDRPVVWPVVFCIWAFCVAFLVTTYILELLA